MAYILTLFDKDHHLSLPESHADFAQYLFWLHFANGSFQPALLRNGPRLRSGQDPSPDDKGAWFAKRGLENCLVILEDRLKESKWLAGNSFTAADIMVVTTLTTMRQYFPYDLGPYTEILKYLSRIGAREAFQRARQRGDPGMDLCLGPTAGKLSL